MIADQEIEIGGIQVQGWTGLDQRMDRRPVFQFGCANEYIFFISQYVLPSVKIGIIIQGFRVIPDRGRIYAL